MSDDKKGGALTVPKFPHSSTVPRSEKWRRWTALLLSSTFGMKYPFLTNLLSQKPDATEEFWGFDWDSVYDWYNIPAAEERTLGKEFMMAQYALYHALTESFQEQQRHIIESHAPEQLTRTLRARYQWPLGHDNLDWLPFGFLCLQAMGEEYDDSGVTDAIAKHTNFEQAKSFNPAPGHGYGGSMFPVRIYYESAAYGSAISHRRSSVRALPAWPDRHVRSPPRSLSRCYFLCTALRLSRLRSVRAALRMGPITSRDSNPSRTSQTVFIKLQKYIHTRSGNAYTQEVEEQGRANVEARKLEGRV